MMVEKLTLRIKESWTIALLLMSWVVSQVIPKKQGLWLVSERGTDARDNGYWMFRYIKQHHPEISAKYIIPLIRRIDISWKNGKMIW